MAPYRAIRERDLVGRRGQFIAEGRVVLDVLLRARHEVQSLLISESKLAGLAPVIARLPAQVPVYAVSSEVMDKIAGFPVHRGILALGVRAPAPDPQTALAALGPRALVLVLIGTANHDNMGGLFRNAAAFGVDLVLLDAQCCDPLYRKAIRVSVGASLIVPFTRFAGHTELLDGLAASGFEVLALTPSGETALSEIQRPTRCALLFGTEGAGLPAAILARTRTLRIAMSGALDSLNVATTSGIVLHHLTAQDGHD